MTPPTRRLVDYDVIMMLVDDKEDGDLDTTSECTIVGINDGALGQIVNRGTVVSRALDRTRMVARVTECTSSLVIFSVQ